MQQAQCLVALRDVVHEDAERHDVGELLERDVLGLHLAPDRVGRLLPALDLRIESAVLQRLDQLGLDLGNQPFAALAQIAQARLHRTPAVRIEFGERQLLELALDLFHADARRERRIELHGLAGDALAPRRLLDVVQGAHVVQAVGELHEQNPDVRRHREHQLAQVLGFLGALGLDFQPRQLGHAVDQARDVLAEQARDLVARRVGILEGVVQQPGNDRGRIEFHLGQDAGHLDGMGEIRIAGGPELVAVSLQPIDVGAIQRILVRLRIVGLYALNEFELTNHRNHALYGADCVYSTTIARIARLSPARPQTGPYSVTSSSSAIGRAFGWAASAPPWARAAANSCSSSAISLTSSGLSMSACFCMPEISESLSTAWSSLVSAISRSATTGFLSRSRSKVIWAPDEMSRARWAANMTSSKRLGTCTMQSSTVTRAMATSDFPGAAGYTRPSSKGKGPKTQAGCPTDAP